jgi:hypothetical protein
MPFSLGNISYSQAVGILYLRQGNFRTRSSFHSIKNNKFSKIFTDRASIVKYWPKDPEAVRLDFRDNEYNMLISDGAGLL